jgi:2-C-methyl-D-erythritol 4-phosphate cytidylyltransferase
VRGGGATQARVVTVRAAAPVQPGSVALVLLAGGVGKRMGAPIPKQYIPLRGQPIATFSLETMARMEEFGEVVVVCNPDYREVFEAANCRLPITFALPGDERQDSVFNGLQAVSDKATLVAIYDSARPLVTPEGELAC